MKLRKIYIEDYKMFKDFDISFVDENDEALPIIILAGINGSGKTTLLECVFNRETISLNFDGKINMLNVLPGIGEYKNIDRAMVGISKSIREEYPSNYIEQIFFFRAGIDDTKKVAEGNIEAISDLMAYGRDIEWVLEEVMGTQYTRERSILKKIEACQILIDEEQDDKAEKAIDNLEATIGVSEMMVYLLTKKLRGK